MRQTSLSKYDLVRTLSDGFKRWNRLVERNLLVVELTPAELRALRMLSGLGPSSMVMLAKEQSMTAPGMTIVIDNLEEAGLVRRVRSDADRRMINVAITGKGGEKLRRALKLHDKFIERTTRQVTSQEMDSFLSVLTRILAAAEDMVNLT
ncbi:MAG: MarR family transcriptional regulator [Candidatus Bathyarchaeia archaeon]|jgi:DNA-binding MarR family transcriptional regulator